MKRKIFLVILVLIITITNIILFKNFYNDKINKYNTGENVKTYNNILKKEC